MTKVSELIDSGISLLASAAEPGIADSLRVLVGLKALSDNGEHLAPQHLFMAHTTMINASRKVSDELRIEIIELVNKLSKALAAMGYPGYAYPNYDRQLAGDISLSAQMSNVREESEGLEWEVRVLKSGITVDRTDFHPPEVVREALPLVDGVKCFADHPDMGKNGSVTRLVGWLSDPKLKEEPNGDVAIYATLHLLESSPYSDMIRELYLRGAKETVGLSINANGKAHFVWEDGRLVRYIDKIDEIRSVDLVAYPNAGGAIVKLKQEIGQAFSHIIQEEMEMEKEALLEVETSEEEPEEVLEESPQEEMKEGEPKAAYPEPEKDEDAELKKLVSDLQKALAQLQKELQQERKDHEVKLMVEQADMPEPLKEKVMDRAKKAETLEDAKRVIEEARTTWASAVEIAAASQPLAGRVVDNPQRNIVRLQSMIAGERIEDVEPFTSVREAFSTITGKPIWQMSNTEAAAVMIREAQGFDGAIRETIETTDWAYALGQALQRELVRQYKFPLFDDWRKVVSDVVNLRSMRTNDRMRHGYYDLLPTVPEGGTYQPLTDPSEDHISYAPTKRGGLASWTWESALNDDLGELREIPRRLALAAKMTLWHTILNIFAAATPPTCSYDSTPLFHSNHSNLASVALTSANYAAARKAMMTQTATGSSYAFVGMPPKYLLVPPDLEATARKLLNSDVDIDSSGPDIGNPWKGTFDIIVIPFWSDTNAWALCADPKIIPTFEVGFLDGKEEPTLMTEAPNTGSQFTADKVTYKVRHVWGYGILDHRGVYKSNGPS